MKKSSEKKIVVPDGIKVEVNGKEVKFSNANGEIKRRFKETDVDFEKKDNCIVLKSKKSTKKTVVLVNTLAAHLKNMIAGLTNGYKYELMVVYSHFPMSVAVKDGFVEISNFTGEKKMRKAKIIGNVKVEVKGKQIIVTGNNKEAVGQTAANMETATKVRGGKDVRIFQDGIYITKKGEISE